MALQSIINKNMAFGVPGTHGNGQPYFADSYIAGAAVTIGKVAALDTNGNVIECTGSNPLGLIVNPNEHVRMVLPTDEGSLQVAAGSSVAVAKGGSWYIDLPGDAYTVSGAISGAATITQNVKKGAKVYVKASDGSLTFTAASNTEFGEIVEFAATAPTVKKGSSNWEVDTPAKGTCIIRIK